MQAVNVKASAISVGESSLTYIENPTYSVDLTGAASTTVGVKLTRVGNTVTATFGLRVTSATATDTFTSASGAIPSDFTPSTPRAMIIRVRESGVSSAGEAFVLPDGRVTIAKIDGGDFTTGNVIGWDSWGAAYVI